MKSLKRFYLLKRWIKTCFLSEYSSYTRKNPVCMFLAVYIIASPISNRKHIYTNTKFSLVVIYFLGKPVRFACKNHITSQLYTKNIKAGVSIKPVWCICKKIESSDCKFREIIFLTIQTCIFISFCLILHTFLWKTCMLLTLSNQPLNRFSHSM